MIESLALSIKEERVVPVLYLHIQQYEVVWGIQETLRTFCDQSFFQTWSFYYDVSELEITEGPRAFVEKNPATQETNTISIVCSCPHVEEHICSYAVLLAVVRRKRFWADFSGFRIREVKTSVSKNADISTFVE